MSDETFTNTLGGWAKRFDVHALELAEAGDYDGIVMVTAAADALDRRQAAADVRDNAATVDRQAAIVSAPHREPNIAAYRLDEIRLLLQPIIDISGCVYPSTTVEVARDVMKIVEGE